LRIGRNKTEYDFRGRDQGADRTRRAMTISGEVESFKYLGFFGTKRRGLWHECKNRIKCGWMK